MKATWWLPLLTLGIVAAAFVYFLVRMAVGAGTDDAGTTLGAAILFPPALALFLASVLARNRPLLRILLLVGTVILSGGCVLAMMSDPVDPFALAGIWVVQWIGGVAALVVALVAWLIGRTRQAG
jgi:hypothetical protein